MYNKYIIINLKNMKKTRTKKRVVKKKRPVKKKKVIKRKPIKKKPAKKKKPVRKKKVVKKRKPVRKKVKPKKKKKKVIRKKKRVVKKRKPVKKKKRVMKKRKPIKKRKVVKKRKVARKRKPVKRRKRKKAVIIKRSYSVGGPLEQLFESPVKVQVMKLFFRNPESDFLLKEASRIIKTNLSVLKKEMKRLEKLGLLKAKRISARKELFSINPNFDFFNELRELILKASPVSRDKMLKSIRGLGKIKLVLLSGLFVGNDLPAGRQGTSRADLLIVGDNINQRKLAGFIKNLEAEAGTDINCVVMTTEEFNYRYDMYDRFIRDLLSDKGEFLINKLNI